MVMTPPLEILNETRRIVATMANGGLQVPESFRTPEEDTAATESAEKICRDVHADQAANGLIKTYEVKKIKCIPGKYREGRNGEKDRLQVFSDAVSTWPHLFTLRE
eukprot:4599726-Pyramimonas_sp.AAC.1